MQFNHGLATRRLAQNLDPPPLTHPEERSVSQTPVSYFGTLVHFVRSASPYYEIQTNRPSVPFSLAPPRQSEPPAAQDEGLSETLSFVHRTCALTSLGSSFLGLPSEVSQLLGAASQCASLGEVVLALGRYISQAASTSTSLEREAGAAAFTEALLSNDDEEEELYFDALNEEFSESEPPRQREEHATRAGTSSARAALALGVGLSLIHGGHSSAVSNPSSRDALASPEEEPDAPLPSESSSQPDEKTSLGTTGTGTGKEISSKIQSENTTTTANVTANTNANTSTSQNATVNVTTPSRVTHRPLSVSTPDAVLSSSSSSSTLENSPAPIHISNVEDLQKIGREPGYPLNGHYVQSGDLDASALKDSIGEKTSFSGHFNGQGFQIRNLTCPLFEKMCCKARISNLFITGARLVDSKTSPFFGQGLLARQTDGLRINLSNITIENCTLMNEADHVSSGFLVGMLTGDSILKNITIRSSTLSAKGDVLLSGGLAGRLFHSRLENVRLENVEISTEGLFAISGVAAGIAQGTSSLKNVHVKHCKVSTKGERSSAGVGVGVLDKDATIEGMVVHDCTVSTEGRKANAGGAVGYFKTPFFSYKSEGYLKDIEVKNTQISTQGEGAMAGGILGAFEKTHTAVNKNMLENIRVENSTVSTQGREAYAGLLSGNSFETFENISIHNNTVSTSGVGALPGILTGRHDGYSNFRHLEATQNTVKHAKESVTIPKPPSTTSASPLPETPIPPSALPDLGAPLVNIAGLGVGVGVGIGVGLLSLGAYYWYRRRQASFLREAVPKREWMNLKQLKRDAPQENLSALKREDESGDLEKERFLNALEEQNQ